MGAPLGVAAPLAADPGPEAVAALAIAVADPAVTAPLPAGPPPAGGPAVGAPLGAAVPLASDPGLPETAVADALPDGSDAAAVVVAVTGASGEGSPSARGALAPPRPPSHAVSAAPTITTVWNSRPGELATRRGYPRIPRPVWTNRRVHRKARARVVGVPEDLARLTMELLSRDPATRSRPARDVLVAQ